jgi:hypothetical protein
VEVDLATAGAATDVVLAAHLKKIDAVGQCALRAARGDG